jgi:hypothetical protein
MKKKNYIVELMFMGFLFVVAVAFGITLIEPENDPLQIVDSVEYARVIIGLFLAFIIIVTVQTLKEFVAYLKANPVEHDDGTTAGVSDKLVFWLVIATGIVFFFYCFSMKRLGYYASGMIMLMAYQMVLYKAQNGRLDKKGIAKIIAISAAVTAVLYLVFSVTFQLYLPRGILI